ncbi:MAG: M1 family metallopeptidase [Planctomycetota bacterium]
MHRLKLDFLFPVGLLLLGFTACVVPQSESAVDDPPAPLLHPPVDRGYDTLSYGLEIELGSDRAELVGTTRIRLRATRELKEVVLDAVDMEILGVTSELSRVEVLPFLSKKRTLVIPFGRPIAANDVITLDIQYRTSPLAGMHFVLPSESGVDHPPHVYTQGEAQRARFWFPCNDNPADRATHTLRARVPRSWITVAAGDLVEHELDADGFSYVDTWVMDEEMPTYLFTFAAGPLLKLEDRWEDVALWYVGEPADVDLLSASFSETGAVLGFISEYTGFRYPFSKYAQVAVRDFPFGGMENVSATTVTRNALHSAEYQASNPSWGLVAHEAAHQWFGDIVTCMDWTHAWLNEGFATYFNLLYRRHRNGEADFQVAMGDTIDGYLRACRDENLRPLVKTEYRLPMDLFFDGTIYPGGAARANLFRGIIGEDAFREALKIYLHRHAYRSVDSQDLQQALEDASGHDFGNVFAQWVYAPGYPELDLSWNRRGRELEVQVIQTQSLAGGVPAAFEFPLDVRWYEGGQWRETRFQVTQENQVFAVSTGPSFDGWVEFDPHVYLPAKLTVHEPANATNLRALHGWSARSRVLAVRDLADYQDQQTTDTLWRVARSDKVPGVRLAAVKALRLREGTNADITVLRASFAGEKDAQVRASLWNWVCSFERNPIVHDLLFSTYTNQSNLTGLRVSAFRALAAGKEPLERMAFAQQQLEKEEGEGQRLHLAAMQILAGLAQAEPEGNLAPRVQSMLLPLSWKGHSTRIRTAAIGYLGFWLQGIEIGTRVPSEQSILDTLHNALTSKSALLRRAAVSAIVERQDLFPAEIRYLLAHEPDARVRRLLEE